MDKHFKDYHHGGGFFNGFLFGAIIGAAVVFFLFTDKGKKLLKTITEEGLEGFADLQDLVGEEMDEDEYEETKYEEENHRQPIQRTSIQQGQGTQEHASGKVKRFFRGIKR